MTTINNLTPNQGKNVVLEIKEQKYERWPIKTKVVTKDDNILEILNEYVKPYLQTGDIIFISERIVAISQGRAYPIKEIIPSRLANLLVRYVYKSPHGIGLGSPWTMELAIREVGILRILLASVASAITKPFGIKGVFYIIGGRRIAAIDGPCSYTLPPFNEYAKLAPHKPNKVARDLKQALGHEVVIIDANDLGVNVLGRSSRKIKKSWAEAIFKDNPLGQTNEQTPVCVVRAQSLKSKIIS